MSCCIRLIGQMRGPNDGCQCGNGGKLLENSFKSHLTASATKDAESQGKEEAPS